MIAAAVLKAAEAAGVHIKIDNGDLVLEADAPPPDSIVDALSSEKAGIIALLKTQNGDSINQSNMALFPSTRSSQVDQIPPFREAPGINPDETAINDWLNSNPVATPPDRCAWCFRAEDPDHAVVPFGVHGSGHIWLHGECWDPWRLHRRQMAVKALKAEKEPCHRAVGQTGKISPEETVNVFIEQAADNVPNGGVKP